MRPVENKRIRRSRERIILDILDFLAAEDRHKTAIVYSLNLSFVVTNRHLERLVETGSVAWNERTRKWYLTPAGEDCRKALKKSLKTIEAIL